MKMYNYPSTQSLNDVDKLLVAKPTAEEGGFETYTISGQILKRILTLALSDNISAAVEAYTAPVVITESDTTPPSNTNALWVFNGGAKKYSTESEEWVDIFPSTT